MYKTERSLDLGSCWSCHQIRYRFISSQCNKATSLIYFTIDTTQLTTANSFTFTPLIPPFYNLDKSLSSFSRQQQPWRPTNPHSTPHSTHTTQPSPSSPTSPNGQPLTASALSTTPPPTNGHPTSTSFTPSAPLPPSPPLLTSFPQFSPPGKQPLTHLRLHSLSQDTFPAATKVSVSSLPPTKTSVNSSETLLMILSVDLRNGG